MNVMSMFGGRVGVCGDEILGQAWVQDPRRGRVGRGLFEQCLPDPHHCAALHLVAGGHRVQNPAGTPGSAHVADANKPEVGVDGELDEPGAERPGRGVLIGRPG